MLLSHAVALAEARSFLAALADGAQVSMLPWSTSGS